MKHIAAALVAAFSLFGCATTAPKPAAAPPIVQCENNPTRFITDAKGAPSYALYYCYREDGVVVAQARPLSPEQVAAVAAQLAPKPAAPKAPAPKLGLLDRLRGKK